MLLEQTTIKGFAVLLPQPPNIISRREHLIHLVKNDALSKLKEADPLPTPDDLIAMLCEVGIEIYLAGDDYVFEVTKITIEKKESLNIMDLQPMSHIAWIDHDGELEFDLSFLTNSGAYTPRRVFKEEIGKYIERTK